MPISLRPAGKAQEIAKAILGTPDNSTSTGKRKKGTKKVIHMGIGVYEDDKIK